VAPQLQLAWWPPTSAVRRQSCTDTTPSSRPCGEAKILHSRRSQASSRSVAHMRGVEILLVQASIEGDTHRFEPFPKHWASSTMVHRANDREMP